MAQDFELTFRTLKVLPCDVFLGAHGSYFEMEEKFAEMKSSTNPFVDPEGYKDYVADREKAFRAELAKQSNNTN